MNRDCTVVIIIVIMIIIMITNVITVLQMEGENCQAEYLFGVIPSGTCDQGLHCVKQDNMAFGAGICVKSHPDVDLGLHRHPTERGQSVTLLNDQSINQSINQSVSRSVSRSVIQSIVDSRIESMKLESCTRHLVKRRASDRDSIGWKRDES